MSAVVQRACYEDPADDTDEDLSKVPEDYGRSKNTKKPNLRLKERWARSVTTPAKFGPVAHVMMNFQLTHLLPDTAGPKRLSHQPIRSGKMRKGFCARRLPTTCTDS